MIISDLLFSRLLERARVTKYLPIPAIRLV